MSGQGGQGEMDLEARIAELEEANGGLLDELSGQPCPKCDGVGDLGDLVCPECVGQGFPDGLRARERRLREALTEARGSFARMIGFVTGLAGGLKGRGVLAPEAVAELYAEAERAEAVLYRLGAALDETGAREKGA